MKLYYSYRYDSLYDNIVYMLPDKFKAIIKLFNMVYNLEYTDTALVTEDDIQVRDTK